MNGNTQLFIETLNLNLPSGFESRADSIARETVRQLASLSVNHSAQLASLDLPTLKLSGGETNRAIARRIAHAIQRQVNSPSAGVSRPEMVARRSDRHD